MIKKLKDFSERRRLKKVFSKMVSPSVVSGVLENKSDFKVGAKLSEKTLGVVLVLLRYSTHDEMATHMSLVASLAREHEAWTQAITNCLMVFCYGSFPSGHNSEERRCLFVEALQTKLGDVVRIVHGTGKGFVGLVGSDEICGYTFLMPKFDEALRILCTLPDGKVREMAFS
jgi:hypothetical protein